MQKTKSNTSPKISVIVPVYNTEKFLPTCLESIINQTYQNLEIIIINDGSTDSSLTLCEQYQKQDKRIKIINKKNEGQAIARNTGIKESTGNYIHFIDSDDFISLNYYENMLKAGEKTNADILIGGIYNEKSPHLSFKFKNLNCYTSTLDKLEKTLITTYHYAWRYLIKREFITKNNLQFIPKRLMEDGPFIIKAAILANKIITVPKVEYFYRYNHNSIMNKPTKTAITKKKADKKYMNEVIKNILQENNITIKTSSISTTHHKFLGLPIITKKIYIKKIVYYLFGIKILEIR